MLDINKNQINRVLCMKKIDLRDFQKEDVLFMKKNNYRVLVANGQGTGKTIECLAAISVDRQMLCPAVIVCPSSVLLNWQKEARKWCKWARIHVIANRKEKMPNIRHHIYIVSWNIMSERYEEIIALKPKMLIADEAHFAKNEETNRSKALYDIAKKTPHLLLLTGTPLVNNTNELDALHNLFGTDKPPMIRRLLSDVAPDVPEKSRLTLPVYLRPRHAKEYKKAFEEFDEWLKEELAKRMDAGDAEETAKKSLAAEALIKIGYLRRLVGKAKTYAAVDFISRAVRVGEPLVVFCDHGQTIDRITLLLKKQNIGYVVVRGSTPKTQRQKNVEDFQNGKVPIFIGTKAAHTGITLTRARHLVFVERFWTSADEEQAEDRVRRISQKYPTKIWFLHAIGTVDDRIADIIDLKRKMVARSIGSEEIVDEEQETVLGIIEKWSQDVKAPTHNGDSMLGLVKSLPPLPHRSTVQSILFKGKRWNESSVRAWCRMHKYKVQHVKINTNTKQFDVLIQKSLNFKIGTIKIMEISKNIYITHGEPINKQKIASVKTQPKKVMNTNKRTTSTKKKKVVKQPKRRIIKVRIRSNLSKTTSTTIHRQRRIT